MTRRWQATHRLALWTLLLAALCPIASAQTNTCADNDAQIAVLARTYNIAGITGCATALPACADTTLVGSTVRALCPVTCDACGTTTTTPAPTTTRPVYCTGSWREPQAAPLMAACPVLGRIFF